LNSSLQTVSYLHFLDSLYILSVVLFGNHTYNLRLMRQAFKSTSKLFFIFFVITLVIFVVGCEDNELSDFQEELILSEDDEEGTNQEEDGEGTVDLVTYDNTARAILDTHCIECHNINNATAGVRLDAFQNAFEEAESGIMLMRMQSTTSPMPPSGNLPNALIQDIIDWVDDGILEN